MGALCHSSLCFTSVLSPFCTCFTLSDLRIPFTHLCHMIKRWVSFGHVTMTFILCYTHVFIFCFLRAGPGRLTCLVLDPLEFPSGSSWSPYWDRIRVISI
ncbi:hypothetical protein BGX38DRAFT_1230470 [Terfezia claveryi]|nr:hypothetical protein BGX38DRAFT_1230470 [Terfezia claveryi]